MTVTDRELPLDTHLKRTETSKTPSPPIHQLMSFLPTTWFVRGKGMFSQLSAILFTGGGGVPIPWCTGTGRKDQVGRWGHSREGLVWKDLSGRRAIIPLDSWEGDPFPILEKRKVHPLPAAKVRSRRNKDEGPWSVCHSCSCCFVHLLLSWKMSLVFK